MFVIEAFSVAFKLTGMATNRIKFQVASLFTTAGFTTAESELITNDERRRKIAVTCIYTGHVFSVVIMVIVLFYRQGIMGTREFSWQAVIDFFQRLFGKSKRKAAGDNG